VLNLQECWAYCLDLPSPFGEGPAEGHAMAISPDGLRLSVADATSGSLVQANTQSLAIERVAAIGAAESSTAALASAGPRVFVGAGPQVRVVDEAGTVTARWSVAGDVRGLGLSRDGTRLYAGGTDEIVWLDTATGTQRGRVPVAGLTGLRHVR
jgi:DNA-binding beta-propeller fold protein YncE